MTAPDTEPTDGPPSEEVDGFLSRWSRRKRAVEAGEPPGPGRPREVPAVDLPDPATLGFDADFSAYLGARVPAALKREALGKLFADPSFNRMDGLDVYIEDYNLTPLLPVAERDLLTHARALLDPTPEPGAVASADPAGPGAALTPPAESPPGAPPGPEGGDPPARA